MREVPLSCTRSASVKVDPQTTYVVGQCNTSVWCDLDLRVASDRLSVIRWTEGIVLDGILS